MNKKDYILLNWVKTFPQYSDLSYDDVMLFIGRSQQLKNWLLKINENFVNETIAPDWFIKAGNSAKDWSKFHETYLLILKNRSDKSKALNDESVKHRIACDKIVSDYTISYSKLAVDPIIQIASISFEDLPDNIIFKGLKLDTVSINNEMSVKSRFEHDQVNEYKTYLCKEYYSKLDKFKLTDYVPPKVK
jgi:hypothetical protein